MQSRTAASGCHLYIIVGGEHERDDCNENYGRNGPAKKNRRTPANVTNGRIARAAGAKSEPVLRTTGFGGSIFGIARTFFSSSRTVQQQRGPIPRLLDDAFAGHCQLRRRPLAQ